ncbi:MAG: TIGR03016 family PEP-CTERM system-associated outer membrane protein [Rubrivivax sp.]|nr:TIGR03016 family PEP-CTERM system-associated outer membrane protein [Rubrivivax sp.]
MLPAPAAAQAPDTTVGPAAPTATPRTTTLSTGLTLEANALDVRARSVGNGTEALVRASPALTLTHQGARLQGSLVYGGALTARRGIDDREDTDYVNSLSTTWLLEAIEGVGFIDARASVTQQAIYVVGTPLDAAGAGTNRTEVITASLSPYLRGTLGRAVEYELRATGSGTKGDDAAGTSSKAAQASFFLRSPRRGAVLGWGLSGARQKVKFSAASSATTTDRLGAELSAQPDLDWRFVVTGGQERTDVVGAVQRDYENYGVGAEWTPSPRTTVSLRGEQRYFGHGHRVSIEHRLQRSTFSYVDSRDVTGGADTLAPGNPVTLYELLFAGFASQIPDPAQRDQFVLAFIQALGRSRDEVVSGGLFGNVGTSVVRRRELVWTWTGPRLTWVASAFKLDSERVDAGGFSPPGLNDNVAQTGYAASIGWRLTPLTSVNASGSRAMSTDKTTFAHTDLKSATLGLTSRLGVRTTGALGVRYSVLNGTTDPHRETALTGSISLRF